MAKGATCPKCGGESMRADLPMSRIARKPVARNRQTVRLIGRFNSLRRANRTA
jgi:hypothetical protein